MIKGSQPIDKYSVLSRFSEEDIFYLAGILYSNEAMCNPLRHDVSPKCRFSEYNDVLYFCDGTGYFGKNCVNAFEAISFVYKTKPGYETFKFIMENCKSSLKPYKKLNRRKQIKTIIRIETQPWKPTSYLVKHGFPPEVLESELMYLVKNYYCNDRINPHIIKKNPYGDPTYLETIAYCFPNGNIKLYWPNKKKDKFFTNCVATDIWGSYFVGDVLNVTKSGKDYLFLKHMVKLEEVIATQTENTVITSDGYNKIRYFYDSDPAGIKISTKLHNEGFDTRCLLLSKDPFELLEQRGKDFAINYIKCMIS